MGFLTEMLSFLVRNLARTEMILFLKKVTNYKIGIEIYLLEGSWETNLYFMQTLSTIFKGQ